MNIIRSAGYPYEVHEVITSDGYILRMHRIPPINHIKFAGSILLMHGIALTSHNFVYPGKDALAFTLADAGFDVWMGNVRGSISEKHQFLDPSSTSYWNFTMHEFGTLDLPAKIDYILDVTKQKSLYYLGFSQGGTIVSILLAMLPKYNHKIRKAILMSPGIYLGAADQSLFWMTASLMVSCFVLPNILQFIIL